MIADERSTAPSPATVPGGGCWPAGRLALVIALVIGCIAVAGAAELKQETITAWDRYIEATEQRIAEELTADGSRFLVLDFAKDAAGARRAVLAGEVRIERMETPAADGERIRIPKGTIHHWRGSVLIPDIALKDVLYGLVVAIEPSEMQADVIESRVIERDGDQLHLFLRLRRRQQMVTVDYNSEHRAAYNRHGPDTASSRTTAIRIAELENAGSPDEREKPVGQDRGFLWRLRTYWRYQQVDEGVIAECESVSLSRGMPRLLSWMVRPLVNAAVRDVLTETLTSISAALSAAAPFDHAPQTIKHAGGA